MKNVLVIGSEMGGGGAERSLSLLSHYLEKLGYNTTLCILSGKDREQFFPTCSKVVFIDPPAHTNTWGKIKAWRYRISKVKQLKKDNNIDVSISFLEGPDYVNVLTKGKEKVVLSLRGSKMFDKFMDGKMGVIRRKALIPFLYKKADELVCVAQALSDEMHEYFKVPLNKLTTIYNFYENEEIVRKSNESLTTEEARLFSKPVIVNSGRLHVQKEQDKLITILARVKKQVDARLIILGTGELKEKLIVHAKSLGLKACDWETKQEFEEADVYIMGYQRNAFKFYRHSSLFALSSSWEGFPNVMAEAVICNKPIVSTDCPTGPREIFDIKDISKEPIKNAIRIDAGTLLPMLIDNDEAAIELWTKEIIHWLQAPIPTSQMFDTLSKRFTRNEVLRQWQKVIED